MELRDEPSRVVNALTVDVEDYFQVSAFDSVVDRGRWSEFDRRVVRNTERLLDLFAERAVAATFFVLGWIAEREPALVRRIAAAGHEVASHGYWHKLVYHQTRGEFREDVRSAKAALEAIGGQPVLGYRAPSFSITQRSLWALDVLAEEGFAYDASIFPIRHDRYGIPSAPRHPFMVNGSGAWNEASAGSGSLPASAFGDGAASSPLHGARLLEIPASTVRVGGVNLPISGGGYFRLLPYAWARWGIRRVNQVEGKPIVFYLHPWELDPGQPRLKASTLSTFRHYRNLSQTERRLRRLLSEFPFDTVASALLAPVAAV